MASEAIHPGDPSGIESRAEPENPAQKALLRLEQCARRYMSALSLYGQLMIRDMNAYLIAPFSGEMIPLCAAVEHDGGYRIERDPDLQHYR